MLTHIEYSHRFTLTRAHCTPCLPSCSLTFSHILTLTSSHSKSYTSARPHSLTLRYIHRYTLECSSSNLSIAHICTGTDTLPTHSFPLLYPHMTHPHSHCHTHSHQPLICVYTGTQHSDPRHAHCFSQFTWIHALTPGQLLIPHGATWTHSPTTSSLTQPHLLTWPPSHCCINTLILT